MDGRQKTNPLQWSVFLDFAEEHPEILTKKLDGVRGKHKYNELWKEISNSLNSMGYLQKTTEKWQKAVSDWKSKVKAKAANINQGLIQTGGGGPMPSLTENEYRLLSILDWTSVTGINVPELGLVSTQRGQQLLCWLMPCRKLNYNPFCVALARGTAIKSGEPTVQSGSKYLLITNEPAEPSAEPNVEVESLLRHLPPSPPPLMWNEDMNNKTDKELKEVLVQKDHNGKITGNSMKQSKVQSVIVTPCKSSHTPLSSKSRLKNSNNELQKMHEETVNLLKEMNKNLGRMADAQERMCSILENYLK